MLHIHVMRNTNRVLNEKMVSVLRCFFGTKNLRCQESRKNIRIHRRQSVKLSTLVCRTLV